MTDSVQRIARAAIDDWLNSVDLLPTPTQIRVEEPEPNAKITLPVFGIAWSEEDEVPAYGKIVTQHEGHDVWSFGEIEISSRWVWRVGSKADAEAVRESFRAKFLIAAQADTNTPVLRLKADFYGLERDIAIYRESDGAMTNPNARDTAVVDYWIYSHAMRTTYPLFVVGEADSVGIMNVLINAGQPDIDPFDMNDFGG
jgi:hypothetical protein